MLGTAARALDREVPWSEGAAALRWTKRLERRQGQRRPFAVWSTRSLAGSSTPRGFCSGSTSLVAIRTSRFAERLLNRELSLLDFHARVLELAARRHGPAARAGEVLLDLLLERRRVLPGAGAGLLGQAESGLAVRSADGLTPHQALAQIRERVLELTSTQSRIWKRELRPALAAEGIVVGGVEDCDRRRS